MSFDLIFQNAVGLHQAGRLDEAEAAYRRLLEISPENADLLAYRRYGAPDGEELLVLCNLTEHDAPYTLPEGWADADKLLGNYPDRNDALRPYECLILTKA